MKVWAGDPSYETIKDRVNAAWTAAGRPAGELARKTTVADCFRPGRRRLNTDLVVAVVQALHPDAGYVTQWRQALRVIGGEIEAAAQVRVQDTPAAGSGRVHRPHRRTGPAPPGAAPRPAGRRGGDLRDRGDGRGRQDPTRRPRRTPARTASSRSTGCCSSTCAASTPTRPSRRPTRPPSWTASCACSAMPGQQIPHDLAARAAAYRDRLAGTRALVVLDNAATAEQVRPLLPDTPGCLTLVTSRRSLTDLHPATHLDGGRVHPRRGRGLPDPGRARGSRRRRTRTPRPGSPGAAATCPWPSAWSPGTSAAHPAGR